MEISGFLREDQIGTEFSGFCYAKKPLNSVPIWSFKVYYSFIKRTWYVFLDPTYIFFKK